MQEKNALYEAESLLVCGSVQIGSSQRRNVGAIIGFAARADQHTATERQVQAAGSSPRNVQPCLLQ